MMRAPFASAPPWTAIAGGSGLHRLLTRQNAHSLYIVAATALLSVTLLIDLAFFRDDLNVWVLVTLLLFCLGGGAAAAVRGQRLPHWVGLFGVMSFAVAQCYFLSSATDAQQAIAGLQEMPILAFYLGWFVRPLWARLLMLVSIALMTTAMVFNPLFSPTGLIGVPPGVHGILIAVLCFEVGSRLQRRGEQRARTDQLTGALNRRGMMLRLAWELRPRIRARAPLSVVVIDFDGLKVLNDTFGHAAGDAVLRDSVVEWREVVRGRDAICRSGGDEFVLLIGAAAYGAEALMRRLRRSSAHSWSWGTAEARQGDTPDSLLARADDELYRSKQRRREQK